MIWAPLSLWFQGHCVSQQSLSLPQLCHRRVPGLPGPALAPLWEGSALSAAETLLTCQSDSGLGRACHLKSCSSWVSSPCFR